MPKSEQTRSFKEFSGGYLYYQDSLTSEDLDDYYFFSVPSEKFITFKIESSNPNYIVELGKVDWNTGMYYSTSMTTTTSGGIKPVNGLTKGDWAIRVYSTGNVEDSYTVAANVTCPSNVVEVLYIDSDLSKQIVKLSSGDLYQNDIDLNSVVNRMMSVEVAFSREDSEVHFPLMI